MTTTTTTEATTTEPETMAPIQGIDGRETVASCALSGLKAVNGWCYIKVGAVFDHFELSSSSITTLMEYLQDWLQRNVTTTEDLQKAVKF